VAVGGDRESRRGVGVGVQLKELRQLIEVWGAAPLARAAAVQVVGHGRGEAAPSGGARGAGVAPNDDTIFGGAERISRKGGCAGYVRGPRRR